MNLKKVKIKESRRMSATRLTSLLEKLPLEVYGVVPDIEVHMGLGRIIYLDSNVNSGSVVTRIKLGDFDILNPKNGSLDFNYKGQRYELFYRPYEHNSRVSKNHRRV